jgi:hypothetical protein
LDEPDIHLHADLQRKLIRLLKGKYRQLILATHSVEIMAEVEPEAVLIVDKNKRASKFATTLPAVQKVLEQIGTVHNIQLSRLSTARKCLFVEGDDVAFLSAFYAKIYPESPDALDPLPKIPIGGSGNWRHAIGASIGLKNAGDERITTYCILDRDYKIELELDMIREEARRYSMELHIWSKKEIENYLIVPSAIHRYICELVGPTGRKPKLSTVISQINRIWEGEKNDIIDAFSTEFLAHNRKEGVKRANAYARKKVDSAERDIEGMISMASGKMFLSRLSGWSKKYYGVSFSPVAIARCMLSNELDDEVRSVLTDIELSRKFARN